MTSDHAKAIADYFATLFDQESANTLKVLRAVPNDRRAYKPDEKSRTAWELATRCAVVEDERDPHACRRRVRRNQDFPAFERGIQIVDGKRQVRDRLHDLRHRTLRVETHPLDAVRAGLKPADMNAELLQVPLIGTGRAVRDAEVVVSPSEPGDGRGSFVPAPYVTHR